MNPISPPLSSEKEGVGVMCFANRSHKPEPIADKHNLVSTNSALETCRIPWHGLLTPDPQ